MGDQMWAVSVSSVYSFSFQLIISKYIYIYTHIYICLFLSVLLVKIFKQGFFTCHLFGDRLCKTC